MRNFIKISLLAALLGVLAGCAPTETTLTTETTSQSSQVAVYEVFGMDCPGCHGGVEKLAKRVPGITDARANWEKNQIAVTIETGTTLNEEELFDAIRRSNFTPGKKIN